MIKNLLLIRHAQAESTVEISDFERKLTAKGLVEATEMSHRLKMHLKPQFILSSPATRALNTAKLFAENLSLSFNSIQLENSIYEASLNTLLSLVNHLNNDYSQVAIIGHNPGISNLANYLCSNFFGSMQTSEIVHLQFETKDWRLISEKSGYMVWNTTSN